jgi:ABC-2 type transport system permease protein
MRTSLADDIWVVATKEWREWFAVRAREVRGLLGVAALLGVCGLSVLAITSIDGLNRSLAILVTIWLPLLLATSYVADSFAGERERHTLETLLATRLSGKAIYWGKVAAAAIYGWLLMVACWLVSLALAALASRGPAGQLPGALAPALLFVGPPSAALTAIVGVWVSACVNTVRHAQWLLNLWTTVLLVVGIYVALGAEASVGVTFAEVGDVALFSAIGIGLAAIDVALLSICTWRLGRRGELTR